MNIFSKISRLEAQRDSSDEEVEWEASEPSTPEEPEEEPEVWVLQLQIGEEDWRWFHDSEEEAITKARELMGVQGNTRVHCFKDITLKDESHLLYFTDQIEYILIWRKS